MSLNFGKLKQWTNEKLRNSEKTDTTEDFKQLEIQTEKKRETGIKLEFVVDNFLKNMGKRKTGVDKDKRTPIDDLATCMTTQANILELDSKYGKALYQTGKAHEEIATNQQEFVYQARDQFYSNLTKFNADMEDFQNLRKKLGTRRLDLDAKLTRVQKSKKEKPELEEELRSTQSKYDDTLSDCYNRMVLIAESEDLLVKHLIDFVQTEEEYHARSSEILKEALITIKRDQESFLKKKDYKILGKETSFTAIERTKSDQSSLSVPVKTPLTGSINSANIDFEKEIKSKPIDYGKPSLPPKTYKKKVECAYAFEAEGDDELSMNIGDIITVLEEVDEGWWIGENNHKEAKKTGLFPVNYTKPYVKPHKEIPRKKSRSFNEKVDSDIDPFEIKSSNESKDTSSVKTPSESRKQKSNSMPYRRDPPQRPTSSKPKSEDTTRRPVHKIAPPVHVARQIVELPKSEIAKDNSGACNECDCDEYKPNLFKKGQCSNCFHRH